MNSTLPSGSLFYLSLLLHSEFLLFISAFWLLIAPIWNRPKSFSGFLKNAGAVFFVSMLLKQIDGI